MKEEKNHVGRPTNEEVKIRKKKKLLRIVLPVLIFVVAIIGIIAFQNISENKLVGAVKGKDDLSIYGNEEPRYGYGENIDFAFISDPREPEGENFIEISFFIKNSSYKKIKLKSAFVNYYDGYRNKWRREGKGYPCRPGKDYISARSTERFSCQFGNIGWPQNGNIYFNFSNGETEIYEFDLCGRVEKSISKIAGCDATTAKKTALKTGLKLDCPETVTVNKEFTCKTNSTGAKISVTSNGLAKGYHTSFTTTTKDKTKQSKYTKAVTVTVKVEKTGYQPVTKKVKIVSGSSKAKSPVLNGGCWAKLSAIGNTKLKYTTQCNGNARVTNIAYKTPSASGFINRGSGWGAYKGGTSTIVFASKNKGKNITVRVYYDTNTSSTSRSHYKDQSIILK